MPASTPSAGVSGVLHSVVADPKAVTPRAIRNRSTQITIDVKHLDGSRALLRYDYQEQYHKPLSNLEPANAMTKFSTSEPLKKSSFRLFNGSRVTIPLLERSGDKHDASKAGQRVLRACTNVRELLCCIVTCNILHQYHTRESNQPNFIDSETIRER